jgi:DNA mismatch endonuclease (patch repair protein)
MRRIRSKDTSPEMTVRRMVHRMGYRYRLHVRSLPGCPDMVFPRLRKIVQVYGCYWHPHGSGRCRCSHQPKSRLEYWLPKLDGNRKRDKRNVRQLRRQGWGVLVIRECQISSDHRLAERLAKFLAKPGVTQASLINCQTGHRRAETALVDQECGGRLKSRSPTARG